MVWEKIITSIKDRFNELPPEQKQRLLLICACGFCVVLTIAVIFQFQYKKDGGEKEDTQQEQDLPTINAAITSQELFLPDEPDFLPGVLLDRERREEWTEEDIMEFWQDPLRAGEEQWRDKVDAAVNEILEGVP